MDFHLGTHWLSSFSLRNSCYLLVELVLCPENLALATVRLGAPWIWLERSMVYTPFATRILPTFISSRESSEFFFLSVICKSISESWEGGIFSPSLGPFLCPWSCLILLGIFPVSPGWHLTRFYLFIYLFIYRSADIRSWQTYKLIFNSLIGFFFFFFFLRSPLS